MKKLLTLIISFGTCIPAVHGTETVLPAKVQKKYDHLIALIKDADVDRFKPAFDALTLPAQDIAALQQIVLDAKTAVNKQIKVLSDKNKSWAKIAQDALAGVYGLSDPAAALDAHTLPSESIDALQQEALNTKTDAAQKLAAMGDDNKDWLEITKGAAAGVYGISNIFAACAIIYSFTDNPPSFLMYFSIPAILPWAPLIYANAQWNWGGYRWNERLRCLIAVTAPFIAYKAIPYGLKTFKAGLDYRQHLQNKIANLDAIAAYIAQAKKSQSI